MYVLSEQKVNGVCMGLLLRKNKPSLRVYYVANDTDRKRFKEGLWLRDTADLLMVLKEIAYNEKRG